MPLGKYGRDAVGFIAGTILGLGLAWILVLIARPASKFILNLHLEFGLPN